MIAGIQHRDRKRFFESGTTRGIQAQQANRIRLILARINASQAPQDVNLPGLYLHELTGQRKGQLVRTGSGNWRNTLRFNGPDAYDVDLEDYH